MKHAHRRPRRLLEMEILVAILLVTLIWLDEILDFPALFMGAAPTPINWKESLFESSLLVAGFSILFLKTRNLLRALHYLEGYLSICACCRRVRVEGEQWLPLETFLSREQEFRLSHGLCPDCAEAQYGEWFSAPSSPDSTTPENHRG